MSTNKFQYWPSDGQLGSTKFTMPTNAEDWPSGDALIGNFVYSEGELVDFIDTKALIVNESKTTTINYDYVNIELPFAEDAMTINRGPRNKYLFIKFNDKEVEEGDSVIVTLKYKGCKTVDDVKAVDPNYLTNDIVDGVWSEGLGDLANGDSMFTNCSALTSFNSDLSSLTLGREMFNRCKIDAESVMYIADTIKDITAEKQLYSSGSIPYVTISNGGYSAPRGFMSNGNYVFTYNNPKPYTATIGAKYVGKLTLGINVTNDADTIQQQLEDFAQEANFETWADLKKHFTDKGWTVTWQYGGTTTSITYGLRNGEQVIPCPIFAKLVETDKDSAEYCTEDASTFYDIEWGHDVTDTSSYTQFNSLEEAMAYWNVFPKENIITTEE